LEIVDGVRTENNTLNPGIDEYFTEKTWYSWL
jgi:hypothetical protein